MVLASRDIHSSRYHHHEDSVINWDAREKPNDVSDDRSSGGTKIRVPSSNYRYNCINREDKGRSGVDYTSSWGNGDIYGSDLEYNSIGAGFTNRTIMFHLIHLF